MAKIVVSGATDLWEAHDGADLVGTVRAVTRPDQRTLVLFRDCRHDAYAPLLARATAELRRDLYTLVDEQDEAGRQQLAALGFATSRREHHYRIPVDPARFRLAEAAPPAGVELISAADADQDRLRVLDDTLRHDIPGSAQWHWTPEEFREETFSDGFDPATYQVAVEQGGAYVGLMRIWMKPAGPRFGCVGVIRRLRRSRVTYALVAAVLGEVHRRGHQEVAAEIDTTNRASNAIAARAGAVRVGGSYELLRKASAGEIG